MTSSSSSDSDESDDSKDSSDDRKKKLKKKGKPKKKDAKQKQKAKKKEKKARKKAKKAAKKAKKKAKKASEKAQKAEERAKRKANEMVTGSAPSLAKLARQNGHDKTRQCAIGDAALNIAKQATQDVKARAAPSSASCQEAKLCPDCSRDLEWSDFAGGCYRKGWKCNNISKCGSAVEVSGKWRWNCRKCTNDFCAACMGLPDPEKCRGSDRDDRSQSLASQGQRSTSTPASSSSCGEAEDSDPDVHEGTKCEGCGLDPIRGPRFKCTTCRDASLCRKCYKKRNEVHAAGHRFFAMKVVAAGIAGAVGSEAKIAAVEPEAKVEIAVSESSESEQKPEPKKDGGDVVAQENADTPSVQGSLTQPPAMLTASELQERWANMGKAYTKVLPAAFAVEGSAVAGVRKSKKTKDDEREVCFIRHAQAVHNVHKENLTLPDNPLTEEGFRQCRKARTGWAAKVFGAADLIVVSPLRRALQTAAELNGLDTKDKRFLVTPLCTERWSAECDEGTPKAELINDLPWLCNWQGFRELQEAWWPRKKENESERVKAFLDFMRGRSERKIVVVSHGGFLAHIVGYKMVNLGYHKMKLEALDAFVLGPRPLGKALAIGARCSLCLQAVLEAQGGATCSRRREDGSLGGCGKGVCWLCMKQASATMFGNARITKDEWCSLGIGAWWMHEKCMTDADETNY